jgi:hypothetical protein
MAPLQFYGEVHPEFLHVLPHQLEAKFHKPPYPLIEKEGGREDLWTGSFPKALCQLLMQALSLLTPSPLPLFATPWFKLPPCC